MMLFKYNKYYISSTYLWTVNEFGVNNILCDEVHIVERLEMIEVILIESCLSLDVYMIFDTMWNDTY